MENPIIRYLVIIAFIFIPYLGAAENFNGTYALKGYSCNDPGLFSRTIKGEEFYNDESYCTLQSKTNVRGMNALLFDAKCSSEGEEYIQRVMLMKGYEKVIYIIQDGWVGEFLRCD